MRIDDIPVQEVCRRVDCLNRKERELLELFMLGRSTQECAAELFIAVHTVRSRVKVMHNVLRCSQRDQAVAMGYVAQIHMAKPVSEFVETMAAAG